MKRYNVVLLIYVLVLIAWVATSAEKTENSIATHNVYWFSLYYEQRIWLVNDYGKIYDVLPEDKMDSAPIVTGLTINEINGQIKDKLLIYVPKQIPSTIFEINLAEKYVTTVNAAIIYLTSLEDISNCLSVLRTVGQYLDTGKKYLFKNGKLYSI
ncbi:MAG: hypothetical protein ACP5JS_05020 [Fervidobacterium sp.]